MVDRNWDSIFRSAKGMASKCQNVRELANMLDIPRSTLRDAMVRRNVTFVDLLMEGTEEQEATSAKLRLQLEYLRKEVVSLKKSLGKREWVLDAIAESAATLAPIPVKPPKLAKAESEQVALLQVSDVHIGQHTPAEQVGILGKYNTDMAIARLRYTFTQFAGIVKQQPFPVNHVYIAFLGDEIEHAHLRPGHEQYVDLNAVKQTLLFSDVASHALSMLAGQFPKVTCICVPGNHGRVTADPKLSDPTENFDYLCYQIMKRLLEDQSNIEWIIPESWYQQFSVYNYNFLAIHGSEILSYVGFPWYGATRKGRQYQAMFRLAQNKNIKEARPETFDELMEYTIVPDYILLAHFHTQANWEDIDVEYLANGSMPGVSLFGASRKTVISRPSQRMFFIHPKYGVGLRCPISLDIVE